MKKLWLLCFLFCSFPILAEEVVDLVMERMLVERKLEKLGYTKWKKVSDAASKTSLLYKQTQLKAATQKSRFLKLKLEYLKLQEEQQKIVERMATQDTTKARKLALEFGSKNSEFDKKVQILQKEQQLLTEMAEQYNAKHVKLEKLEKEVKQAIAGSPEEINSLVGSLTQLKALILMGEKKK